MHAPLPVITTRRSDRRDRGYLAWVAIAHEVAHLHLDSAPIDASPHALEIVVEGFEAPLVVLAEPMGGPTNEGFPLKLSPLDEVQEAQLRRELFGGEEGSSSKGPALVPSAGLGPSSRQTSDPTISQRHVEVLARATGPSAARRAPGSLAGRALGAGRFALETLIGAGASGEVYRGVHAALRRPIAIKVLHPALQHSQEYCARFYSEALAASQLDHRNVLRIIDYGQEPDGLLYIVMELLEGDSLDRLLQESGPMPLERIVHLVSQACAGLAHAHDAGLVHRDIKPENIVVVRRRDDEGRVSELVKVCDFGIAHWSSPDEPEGEALDAARFGGESPRAVGTPAFMAPEQIRGEVVDARADVYALGVVMYELATGQLPFISRAPVEVLSQHLKTAPSPPSQVRGDVDPDLERIIMKALEKDPAKRYADARVMRADLRELADDVGTTTGKFRRVSIRNVPSAADFLASPAEGIALLAQADDKTRGLMLDAAGEAIRAALVAANTKVARDLSAWMEMRASDMSVGTEEREQVERTLRVLRHPPTAAALATHLLEGKIARVEEAAPLLVLGGPVAARALLDARRTRAPALELRGRFVSAMRVVGVASLPVVTGALELLVALASRSDEALAEDLLRSIPDAPSEPMGEITVRFVRLDKPAIGAVALAATTSLWGRRAQPLLLGVLDSPGDAMRIVALDMLKRLGAVDERALERIVRDLGAPTLGVELRVAAAEALAFVDPGSRSRALAFLHQRLMHQQGFVTTVLSFGPREAPQVLVALARSLLVLDPGGGRSVVERLGNARADVKPELDRLLSGR